MLLPLLLCFGSSGCASDADGIPLDQVTGTGGAGTGTGGGATGGGASTGGAAATGGASSGGASSGGASTGGQVATGGESATGGSTPDGFALSSTELSEGGMFMDKHTCQQAGFDNDESPPLAWSGAPEGTMSFAVTFIDRTLVDDGNTLGYHWAIWDLDAAVMALPANLPAGMSLSSPVSATQSRASYLGPCPNYGTGTAAETHTYEFTIYALPTAQAGVSGMIDATMITTLEGAALGTATLSGTSAAYTQ